MIRIATGFRQLVAAALVLGLTQAIVETLAFTWLYRDLLFAPYRFSTVQNWDAFVKAYFALAEIVPFLRLSDTFGSPEFMSKAALLPTLLAINAAMAVVIAVVVTPLALLVWSEFGRFGYSKGTMVSVWLVAGTEVLINVVMWVRTVKIPTDLTITNVVSNLIHNAVENGTICSLVVLGLSVAVVLLATRTGRGPVVAAAVGVAGVSSKVLEALGYVE